MIHSEGFKERILQRIFGPEGAKITALHEELGIARSTLRHWVQLANRLPPMGTHNDEQRESPMSPKRWSAAEKLQVVMEASSIPQVELGEFLRRRGVHEADLNAWRTIVTAAASDGLDGTRSSTKAAATAARRIKELETDLAKKEKRLRAVEALLDLQKKVCEIWGDADEPTQPKSDP